MEETITADKKNRPEDLRAPAPELERILMFELPDADRHFILASDRARGECFAPLRCYLDGERQKAGLSYADIDRAWQKMRENKGGMATHWFSKHQWQLPRPEHYAWLQELMREAGGPGLLQREHEELQTELEQLQEQHKQKLAELEHLRRYFRMQPGDQITDHWQFAPSGNRYGHPTEKPEELIGYMLRLSCPPGGRVLDFFGGSGTTARAAKDLGRSSVLVEREERYCEIAAKRMAQEVLPIF